MTSTLPANDASAVAGGAAPLARPDAAHEPSGLACRNCGAFASGAFCATCGQVTTLHPPTVREFIHEFINHTVAFDGSVWRTLVALLVKPGLLTVEYFAGRRQRYIAPLRLYLTASLLFFAIGGVSGNDLAFGNAGIRFSTEPRPADKIVIGPREPTHIQSGNPTLQGIFKRLDAMPGEERDAKLHDGMRRNLPYVLIVLVPVLALYLKLVYWNRHRLYGEHLVVAFHAQTVTFVYALISAIPLGELFGALVFVAFLVQAVLSMRRVYGGRVVPTLARGAVLFASYGLTVSLALAVLAVVSIYLALPPA
jgi:hypothetical protein